ncbi:MAG: hypothetical protein HY976_02350 [Candidatus Kerfeldbacteria bacterium]|nr:hypothetical protein [Candidatus Kerfeldbacteria bacterium]
MNTLRAIFRRSVLRAISALLVVVSLTVSSLPATPLAAAATKQTDRALLVNQSNRYAVLPPGKSATVWFDFQNTGNTTWTNADPHPVSLNTDGPLRRTSMFQYKRWRATWRPARLLQKEVKPGETGRFRFSIKAPNKPGKWIERFAVVRDRETRISGGEVEFVIVVGKSANVSSIYRAQPSKASLSFWSRPGGKILAPVEFKNTGYASLRTDGFGRIVTTNASPYANIASGPALALQSSSLLTKARRAQRTSAVLDITAPNELGVYNETYALQGPYGVIAGSTVQVQLTVSNEPQPPLAAEPTVRVGVFAPVLTKPVEITANSAYEIRAADSNALLFSRTTGQVSSLTYNTTTGVYSISAGTTATTTQAVRFIPAAGGIMEIKSMSSTYNRFRNVLEIRYAPATKKLWVINELPIEHYMQGLAETSSKAPAEFAKTLITAARTYALYKVFQGKSHDNEFYKINSTTEQVYNGFNYEVLTPNITAAVQATRGIAMTHPSDITEKNKIGFIVAAYSSCTDGRTRSYEERWGGAPNTYPYLISVPDPKGICTNPPYSNAATLLQGGDGNHMVGMSARGALITSQEPGVTY